ncbi:hypothetical protein [Ktedonobacter sp. SOSP1-52]|uniref:hypothetical protein n=1 Tax=Ktedonobacter sp. SOSP1-52 TaxID=2778366 RepID=UPI001915ECD7|nr:hypothetical protein [Ktedonobacter sp. SOSP1-52]
MHRIIALLDPSMILLQAISRVGMAQVLIPSLFLLFHLLPVVTETGEPIVPHFPRADPGGIPQDSRKKQARIDSCTS